MGAAPQLIGRTIAGRFRITGFIGEGAMAAVYRGVQDAEPRDVAIKIMHPQLLGDVTFMGRFRREAKAAARLNHPNTVQIIDYGIDGRLPYIAMELIAGQDLFELLVTERRLSQARAARILIGICDALAIAHEHGIVHRDLKPENVMILRDAADPAAERVKVLDFGIAKIVEVGPSMGEDGAPASLSTSALTTVGVVVGTPAYMSPEQCRGDPVDGRSDLYSCGIMLYLLVTGRLPFQPTGMPWEVAMDHIKKPPPAPSGYLPTIHPGLEATILTALAKYPAQRHQSARELRDELAKLLPVLTEASDATGVAAPVGADTMPVESLRSKAVNSVRAIVEAQELEADPAAAAPAPGKEERPAPPSYRADTETRALPFVAIQPEIRESDPGVRTAPVSSEGPLSIRMPAIPLPSDPPGPSSDTPSIEIWRVSPDAARGVPPTPYLPPPKQDLTWNSLSDTTAAPPAPPAAPGPNGLALQSGAGGVARDESAAAPPTSPVTEVRPRVQPQPLAPLVAQLVVPAAVVVGVVIGVLAFFLTR